MFAFVGACACVCELRKEGRLKAGGDMLVSGERSGPNGNRH